MKRSPDLALCLAASLALAVALAVPSARAAGSAAATEATRASATGRAPAVPMAPPEVPPALQEVRRHMLDADVNALTFHEMDQIFDTRRVPAGTSTWMLPRAPAKMDFSYEFGGKTHSAEQALERTYTNALLIIKHGAIVTELYRNHTNPATHFISFSMAKSITSALIGIALAQHRIHSVDDAITDYVPELNGSGYEGVSIRQALEMRSGVDYDERYDFSHPSLAAAMFEESLVENRIRFAAFAKIVGRAHPPGAQFNYSTLETEVLGWVLERAAKQSISQFMTDQLWKPAGMESYGFWILDGPPGIGREFNGAGFNAVLRDYGRFGLLMLHAGRAAHRQIIPSDWVHESTDARASRPIAPGSPLGYQYQWWTLTGTDAFMAIGLQGQYIFVDPSTDTVVVKLSYFPPTDADVGRETLAFLQAASRWDGH